MSLQSENTELKIEFYDTSGGGSSLFSYTIDAQNYSLTREMTSLGAPFKVTALSGNVLNNIQGFRVKININFDHTLDSADIRLIMQRWITYFDNADVEIRVFPNLASSVASEYIVCALESPLSDTTTFSQTVKGATVPQISLLSKTIYTSLTSLSWMDGN